MLDGFFDFGNIAYQVSVWALPVLIAITFHEAAHGWVAWRLGDDTAYRRGRVTFNPIPHVDPMGTIVVPGLLFLLSAPFLFGYAKPVPVNVSRLRNPRWGMVLVAAAGPAMNFLIAFVSALLFHAIVLVPDPEMAEWIAVNLRNMILLNLVLAVFNLLPIPPLDGGRIMVGILPFSLAWRLQKLERAGLIIVIAVLFLIPFAAGELGFSFSPARVLIWEPVQVLFDLILTITGHSVR
ncbi:MAG: site-2 protease family protein [Alphaproteobacteria bacterium]|nr:site-2 protease family protein [Alphaproteobacteria bacterium]